jgi:hypothetical protein
MFSVIFVLCVVILDLFLFLYLPSGYHRSKLIRKKLHVISQATIHSSTGKLNFTSHGKTFIMEIKDEIIPENLRYNIKYECKRILINNEVISKIHLLDISEVSKHTILTFSPFRPKAEV